MAPPDRFQPRKQPTQDRAAHTRQRILDAAAHIFGEYGYSAGTTNRIAECAEVSIGSLYQYFPNKDAILRALMEAHVDAGAELLGKRLAEGLPEQLDAALRVVVRATIDNHRDNPRLHRVLFEEAPRAPAFLARLHDLEESMVDATAGLLDSHSAVQANGRLSARVVVTTIESLVHRLIASPDPADPQQLEDEIVSLLTRYLVRQPVSPDSGK
ncbi:TetR family transcriptional regulator [Mycobacterium sp. 1245111.1]|nr:TetR family transcriptional regulator [Mycobacterium sp. 1245111.1]